MTPANPFQNQDFAKFQLQSGKAAQVHTLQNKNGDDFFVYEFPLSKKFTILYTYDYSTTLKKLAKDANAIYTLIEAYAPVKIPASQKTVSSIRSFVPRHTNFIDLLKSEEEIFNKMHPKCRYNIRLAKKKNIVIQEETELFNFHQLLKQTADRDGFYLNPLEYYQSMLEILQPKGHAKLFMAYANNVPVAGVLLTFFGDTCIYYYGASSNTHRNLMAPYLLQWHAITYAKSNGYKLYDFLGVANPANPKDSLGGVTYFKQKFGGDYAKWPDSITLVHKPILFALLKLKKFLHV